MQDGRPAEALAAYERVLRSFPDNLEALRLCGVAAFQAGDVKRASRLLEKAVESHPDDYEAHYNLGVVQQSGRTLEAACASFRRAATLMPSSVIAHYNLATALLELGRNEDAVAAYDRAIEADRNFAAAYAGRAFVQRSLGRLDDALASYERAIALVPDDAQTQTGYGTALQLVGRLEEAIEALRCAAAIDPNYPDACTNLADAFVEKGDFDAAIAACNGYLLRHPGDSGVLASKLIAHGERGDEAAVESLADFDRFLWPHRPAVPEPFADAETLNDALAAHLRAHPTLVEAPASHATRSGKHTGDLLGDGNAAVAAFRAMVDGAVSNYIERLGDDPSHPFVANAPPGWRLTVWSIVLNGRGGHQAAHIHPSAWLSGVYYARVPEIVNDPKAGQAGWIEFGQPGEEYYWRRGLPVRAIRPEPGLMVLFPSYFFHRTIPYEDESERISIAFDVLPGNAEIRAKERVD